MRQILPCPFVLCLFLSAHFSGGLREDVKTKEEIWEETKGKRKEQEGQQDPRTDEEDKGIRNI